VERGAETFLVLMVHEPGEMRICRIHMRGALLLSISSILISRY